jgi:hypothetical protein
VSDFHLAARLRRRELDAEAERKVAEVVLEAGEEALPHPNAVRHTDPERARGIPVVVERGRPGAVTSTPPLRTCFTCGRPPRGKRRCRCPEPKGIRRPRATAPRQPERPQPVEGQIVTELPRAVAQATARTDERRPESVYAARACLDCGEEFAPRSPNQKRCGSPRERGTCSWRQARERGREYERRQREAARPAAEEAPPPPVKPSPDEPRPEAMRRLLERAELAVEALRSTPGRPGEGLLLLERVVWPPPGDPDAELIATAVAAWRERLGGPSQAERLAR